MSDPRPLHSQPMSADMLPDEPLPVPQELPAGGSQPPVSPTPPLPEPFTPGDRLTPVVAEPSTTVEPAEPIVLYYIGDGMHLVPGLPGRDLTQADIDTSPYKGNPAQILKFTPAVYAAQPKATDSGPAFEVIQPAPFSPREE